MPDDAVSSSSSSFPRFEGHSAMNLEAGGGGGGGTREKREATGGEGDQGEWSAD